MVYDFLIKLCFRSNSLFVAYLFLSLQEKQVFNCSKWRCSPDVYGFQMREVPGTKQCDVLGPPREVSQTCFLCLTQKDIKSILIDYSRLSTEWQWQKIQ